AAPTAAPAAPTAAPAAAAGAVASFNAPRATSYAPLEYVALGDSFTAGQGAPPYSDLNCLRSRYKSYPVITSLLSPYRLIANKACSGARLADIPAQLVGVGTSTKLVTLTVGGIDAGSTEILRACAPDPGSADCVGAVQASQATLSDPAFVAALAGTYGQLAATLLNARVAVLGYPLLFKPGASPLGDLVNQGTGALNLAIQTAVGVTPEPAGVDRIRYVNVTDEFADHGIGSRVPYIAFDPSNVMAPSNFHPNALGNTLGYYRALANDGVLRR
ncbi:SGNH/GDSL hydrolase family protein, partial [Cryobacterium shii]